MTDLLDLTLDQLHPAADNPRRNIGDVTELAASIAGVGLLEPLVATPNGDGYTIVCGHRRYAAAQAAGLTTVPVIIRDLDERGRAEAMLVENLQRADLLPIEEATTFKRLVDLGCTQAELAERIGRSQSHISKRLSLLDLPGDVQAKVDAGGMTLGVALELTKLIDHPAALKKIATRYGDSPSIPSYVVPQELKIIARKAKAKELADGAKAKGWAVVKEQSEYSSTPPTYRILGRDGPLGLEVTAAAHRKEVCHGAFVKGTSYSDPELVEVCTDPARHDQKAGESKVKAGAPVAKAKPAKKQKWEIEREKEQAARAAAIAERLTFLQGVFDSKLDRPAVADLMASVLVGSQGYLETDVNIAARILRLELGENGDPDLALSAYAKHSTPHLHRAGLALALAVGEASLRWGMQADPVLVPHFTFLRCCGYQLTEAEQAVLDKTLASIKADEEAAVDVANLAEATA